MVNDAAGKEMDKWSQVWGHYHCEKIIEIMKRQKVHMVIYGQLQ